MADAIIALFNFEWNYKRSVQNAGAHQHGFRDLWLLEQMQQLRDIMGWQYRLPAWQAAPCSSEERFGLDWVPRDTAMALAQQQVLGNSGTPQQLLSEEDEDYLAETMVMATRFLGEQPLCIETKLHASICFCCIWQNVLMHSLKRMLGRL